MRAFLRENPQCNTDTLVEMTVPPHLLAAHSECRRIKRFLVNRRCSVQVYELYTDWGVVEHLLVRRHDELPMRSWAELQDIKNQASGPERIALEVFPAESQMVDQANLYHLWVLPADCELPFGLHHDGGGM